MRDTAGPHVNRLLETGLFLVVVACPLAFTPFTAEPFVDVKLLLLVAGAFLAVLGRPQVDRSTLPASAACVLAIAVATAGGRDPAFSMLGAHNQSMGFVALAVCAALLVISTGVTEELRARIPVWIFWTGTAISALAVTGRFIDIGGTGWSLGTFSSTLGHRVFVGGFVAASILAATRLEIGLPHYPALIVIGSALAVTAVRSAWIGTALGLIFVGVQTRARRRHILRVLLPVVVVVAGWTWVDRIAPDTGPLELSAAPRFAQLAEGSAVQRVPAWTANLRAWRSDPLLGSGPSTGWHGFLSHVTDEEIRDTGRGFSDAHNVFVELLATTGVLGVGTITVLAGVVVWRLRRAGEDRAWAVGVVLALGVVHGLQPLNIVLTPLMFCAAGLSMRDATSRIVLRRWIALPIAFALLLAADRFTASAFDRYGSTYGSIAAARIAHRLEPWRITPLAEIARQRAFDHLDQDREAADDVRRTVEDLVHRHPWHPGVRLTAATMVSVIGAVAEAERYLRDQLDVFPHDPLALSMLASLEEQQGADRAARGHATRALQLDPDNELAANVLRRLDEGIRSPARP